MIHRSAPAFTPIAPPADPDAVVIGEAFQSDDAPPERWFSLAGQATVRNVRVATLTPVLPSGEATSAAVIVAAGGAYLMQSMENEAWRPARWLADKGVAAFVLKYRLEPTPAADDVFGAALLQRFAEAADPEKRRAFAPPAYMAEDVRAALRIVRDGAAAWRVDPTRVGFLGFSAGAMIGLSAAFADPAAAPAFLAAVYPSMDPVAVGADAPPLFIALAADDPLWDGEAYGLAQSWRRAGRPTELHVYGRGGHGFGMGAPGTTTLGWMDAFHAWLGVEGWLTTRPSRHD